MSRFLCLNPILAKALDYLRRAVPQGPQNVAYVVGMRNAPYKAPTLSFINRICIIFHNVLSELLPLPVVPARFQLLREQGLQSYPQIASSIKVEAHIPPPGRETSKKRNLALLRQQVGRGKEWAAGRRGQARPQTRRETEAPAPVRPETPQAFCAQRTTLSSQLQRAHRN